MYPHRALLFKPHIIHEFNAGKTVDLRTMAPPNIQLGTLILLVSSGSPEAKGPRSRPRFQRALFASVWNGWEPVEVGALPDFAEHRLHSTELKA